MESIDELTIAVERLQLTPADIQKLKEVLASASDAKSSNPPAHKGRRGRNRPRGSLVRATIHVPRRTARAERAEANVALSRSLKESGEPKPPETGASGT
jgi:hypothetical protein